MYKGFLLIIISICWFNLAYSDPGTDYNLTEEKNLYAKIADVALNTPEGTIHISELYHNSPVIVAFIFTRCTGICSPFLLNLKDKIQELNSKSNFKILVVSFDPADSLSDLENLANRFGLKDNDQWIFATTPQITSLNYSVGFNPIWDSTRQQFDHDALLAGIDKNGLITKKLIGLRDNRSLLSMVRTINDEFGLSYPLPRKNMLFSCFTYDPTTGKQSPSIGLFIMLLPAIFTLLIMCWFAYKSPKWRMKAENKDWQAYE